MKICSDSLLFGAMAPVKAGDSILDIGTGCGLLSLMAAQKGAKQITAVEYCPDAYREANGNFADSPWADRLTAVHQDIQSYVIKDDKRYDVIVSNPPFFSQHLKSLNSKKRLARHTDALPYPELIAVVDKLLATSGLFYVLLPCHAIVQFAQLAQTAGLYLNCQTAYRGFADKQAKVSALRFSRLSSVCQTESMTIYQANGIYTPASSVYLQPFLLRFANTE